MPLLRQLRPGKADAYGMKKGIATVAANVRKAAGAGVSNFAGAAKAQEWVVVHTHHVIRSDTRVRHIRGFVVVHPLLHLHFK